MQFAPRETDNDNRKSMSLPRRYTLMPQSRTFSLPTSAPRLARPNLATPSTITLGKRESSSCTAVLARVRSRNVWFTLRHARSSSLWHPTSAWTSQRDSKPASQTSGQRALWPGSSKSRRWRAKASQDPRDLEEGRHLHVHLHRLT
jgi:hypothetical protein